MHALPEIPLLDVVLGLASAALLLLAAYFLGRPRPDVAAEFDGPAPDPVIPSLFLEVGPDHTTRSLSLVSSLFVHLMGVAMVPWLQLAFPGPLPFRYPQRQAITLEYHIPLPPLLAPSEVSSLDESAPVKEAKEHPDGDSLNPKLADSNKDGGAGKKAEPKLLLPPEEKGTALAEAKAAPDRRRGKEAEDTKAADAGDAEKGPRAALSPKEIVKLVLPPVVETNPALRDIVLQPDFTVPLPDDYKLNIPPVVLWTVRPPKLQDQAILKPTVGDDTTPSHMRLPELEPQLRPPNNLPVLAELQMENLALTVAAPKLPVSTGDVLPLKGLLPAPDALQQAPSIRGGDGTNSLMVFSQDPNIRTPDYKLVPGLRLGSVEASPGDLPAGVVGGTQSLDENAENVVVTNQPGAGDPSNGKGGQAAAGTDPNAPPHRQISIVRGGSGNNLSTVQVVDVTPGPGFGPAGSVQPGDGAGLAAQNGEGPGAGESGQSDGSVDGKGKLKPLPRARYGIILVSNAKGALPEAEGVLSGNPIYTVYFKVPESPRQWILQYCAPKESSPALEISEGVVKVQRRKKLDPPYALRKGPVRLPAETSEDPEAPKRVVIYATFDAEGRFENSRVIKGADPEIDSTILAALRAWEFLPAFAEGEPVMVEALLGVPLR